MKLLLIGLVGSAAAESNARIDGILTDVYDFSEQLDTWNTESENADPTTAWDTFYMNLYTNHYDRLVADYNAVANFGGHLKDKQKKANWLAKRKKYIAAIVDSWANGYSKNQRHMEKQDDNTNRVAELAADIQARVNRMTAQKQDFQAWHQDFLARQADKIAARADKQAKKQARQDVKAQDTTDRKAEMAADIAEKKAVQEAKDAKKAANAAAKAANADVRRSAKAIKIAKKCKSVPECYAKKQTEVDAILG